MNHARTNEYGKCCSSNSEPPSQWLETEIVSQFIKCQIPTLSPKFTERLRQNWCSHDWLNGNSSSLPNQRQQMKKTKVQHENQTNHSNPASKQRLISDKKSCD